MPLRSNKLLLKAPLRRLKKIEEHGEENFAALSWMLERRYPEMFARPEVQLNVGIQNNLAAATNGHHSFESVIVSNLEFLGLRKHENYTHHAHEKPAVDVESEAVPTEVSGVLTLQNHPRSFVISETQNQETQRRVLKTSSKVDALLARRNAGAANAENGEQAPQASPGLVPPAIKMPEGDPPASWWSQLIQGANDREIEKQTAIEVCKTILREVWGPLKAQRMPVEFANEDCHP